MFADKSSSFSTGKNQQTFLARGCNAPSDGNRSARYIRPPNSGFMDLLSRYSQGYWQVYPPLSVWFHGFFEKTLCHELRIPGGLFFNLVFLSSLRLDILNIDSQLVIIGEGTFQETISERSWKFLDNTPRQFPSI